MTGVRGPNEVLCVSPFHRLRLEDGRYVFMTWHHYFGPDFYHDRNALREIERWYDDPFICRALDWFCLRGHRS